MPKPAKPAKSAKSAKPAKPAHRYTKRNYKACMLLFFFLKRPAKAIQLNEKA